MKKNIVLLVFIIITVTVFAQDFEIPKIEWQGKSESVNNYIDLLKLKDKNALIVKIGFSSSRTSGQNTEIIVYCNNGKIKRFVANHLYATHYKTRIKRKKIRKKNYKFYWDFLNQGITKKKHIIDKSKLNITEITNSQRGTITTLYRSHSVDYSLWFWQGKNYIAYSSESPMAFIENEFPGSEERQKLVDLINGFKGLSKK